MDQPAVGNQAGVKTPPQWRKNLLAGFIGAIILAAVPFWFISHRNQEMDRLYAEATAEPDYWRSSRNSAQAVRTLAGFNTQRSTDLLIHLALGGQYSSPLSSETQIEAIKALRGRKNDPKVPTALSLLLQPHVGLDIREAAAESLLDTSCNAQCVQFVLHYLERAWRGELIDDYTLAPNASAKAGIHRNQERLQKTLYSILGREKGTTILALRDVYGLGSDDPSLFAISLVSQIPFPEACGLILRSNSQLAPWPLDFLHESRQALQSAIVALNCK